MKKLFKLQWMVMSNPITLALLFSCGLICSIGDVTIAWEGATAAYLLVRTYQSTTIIINRIIITLASVALATQIMIPKNDHHAILLIPTIKRAHIFYSKWLVFFLIISGFIILMIFFQTIVGLVMIPQYHLSINGWLEWTHTFFCGMIYSLYAMLFTQLIKNSLVALGPMIVFVATSNLSFHGIGQAIAFSIFVVGEVHLDGSLAYLLWFMMLLIGLNAWIYQTKDFSY